MTRVLPMRRFGGEEDTVDGGSKFVEDQVAETVVLNGLLCILCFIYYEYIHGR